METHNFKNQLAVAFSYRQTEIEYQIHKPTSTKLHFKLTRIDFIV